MDFFDVQEQLSKQVANTLKVRLSPDAQKRFTENFDAYVLYLEGRSHQFKLGTTDVSDAITNYQKAIQLDPNYALAYAGIADCNRSLVLSGEIRPADKIEKAISSAETAVSLDPKLAEAQTALGFVKFWFRHDWVGAETAFKQALELAPNSAGAHHHYAHLLLLIGRNDEALREAEIACTLDPTNPLYATIGGVIYQQAGQPETALARFKQADELEKSLWLPQMFTAITYIDLGRYQEALDLTQKISALNESQSMSLAYESVALARLGRRNEAKKALQELLERSKNRYVPPYHLAIAYVGIGDHEHALEWLEKSFVGQDPKIVFLKVDKIWDPLRSKPRFVKLMTDLNLN